MKWDIWMIFDLIVFCKTPNLDDNDLKRVIWNESLDRVEFGFAFVIKIVGLVHCSWNSQVLFSPKTTLKLGPMALFTHLEIILLQYF